MRFFLTGACTLQCGAAHLWSCYNWYTYAGAAAVKAAVLCYYFKDLLCIAMKLCLDVVCAAKIICQAGAAVLFLLCCSLFLLCRCAVPAEWPTAIYFRHMCCAVPL